MTSTKQLKEEIDMLRKKNAEQKLIVERQIQTARILKRERDEKRRLERELKDLKNPRSKAFKRNLKKVGRFGFKTILLAGEDIDRRTKQGIARRREIRIKQIELEKIKVQNARKRMLARKKSKKKGKK